MEIDRGIQKYNHGWVRFLGLKLYKSFYPIECNSRATNAAVDSIMHRKSAVSLQESTGCLDSFDTLFGSHDVWSLVDKLLYASTPVKVHSMFYDSELLATL